MKTLLCTPWTMVNFWLTRQQMVRPTEWVLGRSWGALPGDSGNQINDTSPSGNITRGSRDDDSIARRAHLVHLHLLTTTTMSVSCECTRVRDM
jgi:hypothetical protein